MVAERGAWDPDEIKIDLCCGVVPGSLAWQPSHGRVTVMTRIYSLSSKLSCQISIFADMLYYLMPMTL